MPGDAPVPLHLPGWAFTFALCDGLLLACNVVSALQPDAPLAPPPAEAWALRLACVVGLVAMWPEDEEQRG